MPTPSAEMDVAWHLDDGAATLSNFAASSLNWPAQVFKPDWATIAPGALIFSWFITGVSVRVGKLSGSTAAFQIRVKRVDGVGKPTGSDLDHATLVSADVPIIASSTTQPPWSGPFPMVLTPPTFAIDESAALVLAMTAAATTGYVGCQTGGTNQSPADQTRVTSTNSGSSWSTPSTTVDVIIEVFGKYNTIPGLVAPPLDSATTQTIAAGAGATSHSFSVTVGSNGNDAGCLWVCVAEGVGPVFTMPDVPSGITYAGVDLMEILYTGPAHNGEFVKWYRLLKPPIGTDTVVVSYPGTNHYGAIIALSYFDVDQSQPEGGTSVYFSPSDGALGMSQLLPILGDTNLIGAAWGSQLGGTTAVPQSGTLTIGGSETGPADGIGAAVGRSFGDVQTGWLLSPSNAGESFALGIIGILSTTGLHAQLAPPPPDYSQFPKQLLRTRAAVQDQPDNGPL